MEKLRKYEYYLCKIHGLGKKQAGNYIDIYCALIVTSKKFILTISWRLNMKRKIMFLLFTFIFVISLYGCKGSERTPDISGDSDNKTEDKLEINSYIPDVSKVYTYNSTTVERKKQVKVSFELVEAGKYKRVEVSDNEYKISETYSVKGDAIAFVDYVAENYGSEGVKESIDKGNRIVLKAGEPGDVWENQYAIKREINDINYYNVDGKYTFEGYEKINVMGKEMDAAVISSNETFTNKENTIVEKLNAKFWVVKNIGPVKYEIERINGENKFNASFELISTGEKK